MTAGVFFAAHRAIEVGGNEPLRGLLAQQ